MNFDIVGRTDFIQFAQADLTDDQIDHIIEEVEQIDLSNKEGFHTLVEVDALKKAVKDIWSEDNSHLKYFEWLDTLKTFQYVLIG
jgi:hypothetical protein